MAQRIGPWGRRPAPQAARAESAPAAEGSGDEAAEAGPPPSHYPCGACGAMLGYRPGADELVCAFCGATTRIAQADARTSAAAVAERDLSAALRAGGAAADLETTQVARCEACGARVTFEAGVHAETCPFCASPIVGETSPDRHVKPQAVLPFAIEARQAGAAVTRWLGRLWFAPSGLKRQARTGALSGVYTPYWTFDAQADAAYAGERGDAYTVTVRGRDGKPQSVTRIRWRPARGRVSRAFDDVLTVGSTSLPRDDAEALAPWDLSDLRPYDRDWLAGFRAEAYTIDLAEAWGHAREAMERTMAADARRAIGGDMQRLHRLDMRLENETFKHVLLPVWVGAYRWRGAVYRVLVNGRTGAVRGSRPWSVWKIALAVLGGLALAAAAAWLALAVDGRLPG